MKDKKMTAYFAVVTLFYMAASFAHPVTPTLIVERELDSSMFGIALAAMMAASFLFSPFWGRLCGYIPTRRIILFCSVGYTVGQVIFGAAYSEWMVVAGRLFAGVFTGGCFTAFSNYVINTSTHEQRDANLTALVTIQTVGSAGGYFVGGMLGLLSLQVVFAAQCALLLLCGGLFALVCLDDTPFKARPERPLSLRDADPFRAFAEAGRFMTPMLGLLFAVLAVSGVGYNAFEQCFNYYIKDQFGLSSAYNGTFKILIALLILLLNSTVCIWLQKKTDIHRTFLPVLGACTLLIGALLWFDALLPFAVLYIIYNGVNAIRGPLMQSMAADRSEPDTSNTVMGFYQAMNSLGSIFGSLLAGLIYKAGPRLPFWLAFAAYALSTLLGWVYVRRHDREKHV